MTDQNFDRHTTLLAYHDALVKGETYRARLLALALGLVS